MSPDISRIVSAAPSNQGVHQAARAVEMQAQQCGERAGGLEARMVPGKQKSENLVLPAGYPTALLVTLVAQRNGKTDRWLA
jgi:hypothetical protein